MNKTIQKQKKLLNRLVDNSQLREGLLWRNNLILFISLMLLIFILPVIPLRGAWTTELLLGVVVLFSVFAADFQHGISRLLLFQALVVISLIVLGWIMPESNPIRVSAFLLMVLSLVFSTIALVFHVATASTVNRSTLFCAINAYLLIGLMGSVMFILVDLANPASIPDIPSGPGNLNAFIYFGFVTLTTLGYGDITPEAPLARSFASFIALGGQLYLVIIMALIIGKYLNTDRRQKDENS